MVIQTSIIRGSLPSSIYFCVQIRTGRYWRSVPLSGEVHCCHQYICVCRSELDDTGDSDHYQERFTAVINIFVAEDNCQSTKQPLWAGHSSRNITPDCLFSTRIEKDENFDTFGKVSEI